jgi:hypothetical protein
LSLTGSAGSIKIFLGWCFTPKQHINDSLQDSQGYQKAIDELRFRRDG